MRPRRPSNPERVVVSTYQSVSGAGKEGMDELWDQTKAVYNPTDDKPAKKFTKQIAFNVIPHIDVFLDDGSTKEEWKMVVETKKILDPKIKLTATCVRVPVFVGHSEAVSIEFENEISAEQAQDILREAPGIMLVDKREDEGYITPVECATWRLLEREADEQCQQQPRGTDDDEGHAPAEVLCNVRTAHQSEDRADERRAREYGHSHGSLVGLVIVGDHRL